MSLDIRQGSQKEQNDFSPIEEEDVLLEIVGLTLDSKQTDTLVVKYKVFKSISNNGRILSDKVCYNPNNKFAWKYTSLRESAGVPYSKSEPDVIDIEDLLLGKVVRADLTSVERNGKEYQRFDYKRKKKAEEMKECPKKEVNTEERNPWLNENDPF